MARAGGDLTSASLQCPAAPERPPLRAAERSPALAHCQPPLPPLAALAAYNFAEAAEFLHALDSELSVREPSAAALLRDHGVPSLLDAAWKLSSVLPGIISVPFNPSASKNMLRASISDCVESIRLASSSRSCGSKMPLALPSRDEWVRKRDELRAAQQKRRARSLAHAASGRERAPIPPECPELPAAFQPRPALLAALKDRVLNQASSTTAITAAGRARGAVSTTGMAGMGGVGKTSIAVAVMRDPEVGAAFERLLWVSVSAEPDMLELLRILYLQLTGTKLAPNFDTEREAVIECSRAAKGVRTLLILDDCWEPSHPKTLNFVDADVGSQCIVTTRIRNLADDEVSCGLLSVEESLSLLLTSAGLEHRVDDPPDAALEVVEACGRLALALPIAGSMIRELDDLWEAELPSLLREHLSDELSIEARIVNASLASVEASQRAGVEALFGVIGAFAEDETIPAPTLDLLAPLICKRAGLAPDGRRPHLKVRRAAATLRPRTPLPSRAAAACASYGGPRAIHTMPSLQMKDLDRPPSLPPMTRPVRCASSSLGCSTHRSSSARRARARARTTWCATP